MIKDDKHIGFLNADQVEILRGYMEITKNRMREEEMRQRAIMESARQFNQGRNNGTGGRPPENVQDPNQQAPLQQNELMDESLPTAGGGGNV